MSAGAGVPGDWGEGGGVQRGPSLPLSQCKSLKCSLQAREHSVWLQKYRGQCLTHGKRGRKCSLALVTSSPVHNSQNKQLSSSANYCGRKSALASSMLIQPNKFCNSLSRWDLFFLNLYLLYATDPLKFFFKFQLKYIFGPFEIFIIWFFSRRSQNNYMHIDPE